MKLSQSVKPISYLKAHAAELIRQVSKTQGTLIITQNGHAKAVLQDIRSYEETRESLALLKMLAQSSRSLEEGKARPLEQSFAEIQKRVRAEQE